MTNSDTKPKKVHRKKWTYQNGTVYTDAGVFGSDQDTIINYLLKQVKKLEKAAGSKDEVMTKCIYCGQFVFGESDECALCVKLIEEIRRPIGPMWKMFWDDCQTLKPWSDEWWDSLLSCDACYTYCDPK